MGDSKARAVAGGVSLRLDQVAIVVLNWNRPQDTVACLESLKQIDLGGASILVVDNGSTDSSVEVVQSRFPEQRILSLRENRGYAGGNNAGIRDALERGAEAVVLLNNDARADPEGNFLIPLVEVLNDDPGVAAVCSAVHRLDTPEMLDVAYCEVDFHRRDSVRLIGVNVVPGHGAGYNTREEVQVAVGCSLMMRSAALREVGLFDEEYFAYHEDVDWCLRARGKGYKLFYEPWSRVFHSSSSSTQGLVEPPIEAAPGEDEPQLAQAEKPPWNPVRTYLGARNLIRLLRSYATAEEKKAFRWACLYEIPLEFLAIVMGREGWMTLGRWTYPSMLRWYFVDRIGVARSGPDGALGLLDWMRALALFPLHLFWSLPRDIRTAHVNRRLGQFIAYLRGLNDGIRDRPLPLLRLGLQVRLRRDDVTIIVLNWKRAGETVECLESLAAADLGGASVLVVDNGSTDRSVEIIRERFPDQEILELPENRGYAGGNNAGIRAALEAGAKGVVLLNNDTRVAWDFLSPLLWAANADPRAAAVSSALLRMDNPEMLESAYLEIYFGHGIIRHFGVNALPGEGFGERLQVEVVVGCSVLICADALRDIGLLDESYFAYHEEVDWCFRARRAGYRNYYEPYSRVWHNKSSTTASMTKPVVANREVKTGPQLPGAVPLPWNPIQTYLGARNSVRFIRRHANPWRKLYFALSTLYGVPLEFCAAVLRRESDLKIGAWNYRRTLYMICFGPERRQRSVSEWVGGIFRAPVALFFRFPREIRQAHEEGRTAQIIEHVHGLWDGIRNRPLPLERLGLR